MLEICILKGGKKPQQTFFIDEIDTSLLTEHNWYLCQGYMVRRDYTKATKKKSSVSLHRAIAERMGIDTSQCIDHIDGNKLNNSRSNLRSASRKLNSYNQKIQTNNQSGFKGVSRKKDRNLYRATIQADGKLRHIGYFKTAQEAHDAYCKKASELHGQFARFD